MKRKMIVMVVALLMLAPIVLSPAKAQAAVMSAAGSCFMTPTGKSVSFGGNTFSSDDEDVISITVILQEKRGGVWYEIARISSSEKDTDYVSVSDTVTVSGGYYYKATSTHYTKTGSNESTAYGYTSECWINS